MGNSCCTERDTIVTPYIPCKNCGIVKCNPEKYEILCKDCTPYTYKHFTLL